MDIKFDSPCFRNLYCLSQDLYWLDYFTGEARYYASEATCSDPNCNREHDRFVAATKAIGSYKECLKRIRLIRHNLNKQKRVWDQLFKLEVEIKEAVLELNKVLKVNKPPSNGAEKKADNG